MQPTTPVSVDRSAVPSNDRDRRALALYKDAAERAFGVPCRTVVDELRGEEFPVLQIPVPKFMEWPHRHFAEVERSVHDSVEARFPELVGLVCIDYVPADDAP